MKHFLKNTEYDVLGLVRGKTAISGEMNVFEKNLVRFNDNTGKLVEVVADISPDILIHTATYFHAEHSIDDISLMIEANMLHGNLLLEGLSKNKKKTLFLNTGSSWQNFSNNSDYRAACLHSSHKEAFEKIAEFYADVHEIVVCTLKVFDTYGCGDNRRKIINLLMDTLFKNQSIELSLGEQLIDLVYIDDVAEAFGAVVDIFLTNKKLEKSYGISSGDELPLRDIVEMIRNIINPNFVGFEFGKRPYRSREVFENWREGMVSIPGWVPKVSLDEGLCRVAESRRSLLDG